MGLVTLVVFALALLCCFGPWTTLGPTVAEERYGSHGVFGLLAATLGVGTMIGALLGFRLRPRHPMRMGMLCVLPWPAVTVGCAAGIPLVLLVPLFAVAGAGLSLFGVWWETALAERIPPHRLSRVSAYDWSASLALLPIGFLLAGPLGEALGPSTVLAVGGALATVALAAGVSVRETWTYTSPRSAPPAPSWRGTAGSARPDATLPLTPPRLPPEP